MTQLHPNFKPSKSEIDSMIRVNQAGEYGALRIYAGQLKVLKDDAAAPVIEHMAEQEQHHLATFNKMMQHRGIKRTIFTPLWHIGGFVMGYVSAKFSRNHAMACTIAVEEVIDQHYQDQINHLGECPQHGELKQHLIQFRQEELEHRDIGLDHQGHDIKGQQIFSGMIKTVTRTAIWLSKKI